MSGSFVDGGGMDGVWCLLFVGFADVFLLLPHFFVVPSTHNLFSSFLFHFVSRCGCMAFLWLFLLLLRAFLSLPIFVRFLGGDGVV